MAAATMHEPVRVLQQEYHLFLNQAEVEFLSRNTNTNVITNACIRINTKFTGSKFGKMYGTTKLRISKLTSNFTNTISAFFNF